METSFTRGDVVTGTRVVDLLAGARAAVPVLAEQAARADAERRVSAESVAALREAGVFAVGTPVGLGGLEADTATIVRAIAELGRGCPSSAWVAAVVIGGKVLFVPLMGPQVLEEVFTDPDVLLCGAAMPPGRATEVPGGLRVSGRWPYASGCEDASWAGVSAVTGGRLVTLLVPVPELVIHRTWDTVGLRGTGSHTLVAEEVFVPSARVIEVPPRPGGGPDFSFGRPLIPLAAGLYLLAAMAGAARGALEVVGALLVERKPPLTAYDSLADMPATRDAFARATYLVDSGDRGLAWVAGQVDELLPGPGPAAAEQVAAMRMELVTIVQQYRQAVDMLLDLHGSSGLGYASPLQRFWRDLHMGTRHIQFSPYAALDNYGLLLANR